MSELDSLRRSLTALVDQSAIDALKHVAGKAGKDAALDVIARDLGSDRAFGGMRRQVPLKVGYDVEAGPSMTFNLTPAGLWVLADKGRRRPRRAYSRRRRDRAGRRGGKMVILYGFRISAAPSFWRGFGSIDTATVDIGKAAFAAIDREMTMRVRAF